MVAEGDVLQSQRGIITRIYDLATCTETGNIIVIHGSRVKTYATPLSRIMNAYRVIQKGGQHGDS